MNHLKKGLCALWVVFPVFAFAESSYEMDVQDRAQERCVQERTAQCVAKCDASHMEDCKEECTLTAENECRQAGE